MGELNRQVLIHLHNSATPLTNEERNVLRDGELALLHNTESAATIYARTADGKLAEFGTKKYVEGAIADATTQLEGQITALSAATEDEIERVDGRIDGLSAQTQVIETTANSALQSISKGNDGDYVTTTIGTKTNNDQVVSVAVTVQAVADADAENMGLAEASDVKDYVDGEIEKAVTDVKALSGAVESFSGEVYTNYATKAEVATASANSITSANSYTDTVSGNIETTITTFSAATVTELANTLASAKTYTDEKIDALEGSATIATVADDVVTLKAGIVEVDGVISNNLDTDITLAKVAKTGAAADVSVADAGTHFTGETVEAVLAEIADRIDAQQGGMRYNGGISTATATVNPSTNDVRPGDIYLATSSFTIGTTSVEPGDMIVYKGEESGSSVALTSDNCNVIERENDLMVTADGDLLDGNLVIGKGNKAVATSGLTYNDLMTAIGSAQTALQTVSTGTDHDYVTVAVSEKQNNNQNIEVSVDTVAITAATATTQGLADAYDVKTYVASVSGDIASTINTVSGNIESAIEALDDENVKSVTANGNQDNYVVIAVDNTNAQNPTLSATVITAIVDSAMTVETDGMLESDSIANIKKYIDSQSTDVSEKLAELSGATEDLSGATVEIESDLSELSAATVGIETDLSTLSGATISAIDVTANYSGTTGTVAATIADNKATIDLTSLSIDCGTY